MDDAVSSHVASELLRFGDKGEDVKTVKSPPPTDQIPCYDRVTAWDGMRDQSNPSLMEPTVARISAWPITSYLKSKKMEYIKHFCLYDTVNLSVCGQKIKYSGYICGKCFFLLHVWSISLCSSQKRSSRRHSGLLLTYFIWSKLPSVKREAFSIGKQYSTCSTVFVFNVSNFDRHWPQKMDIS